MASERYDIHSIIPGDGWFLVRARRDGPDDSIHIWKSRIVCWAVVTGILPTKGSDYMLTKHPVPVRGYSDDLPLRDIVAVVAGDDPCIDTQISPQDSIGQWHPSEGEWDESHWQEVAEGWL